MPIDFPDFFTNSKSVRSSLPLFEKMSQVFRRIVNSPEKFFLFLASTVLSQAGHWITQLLHYLVY